MTFLIWRDFVIVAARIMKKDAWESQWESMTIDELFELREMMQDVLMERLKAKKAEIEHKLQMLDHASTTRTPKAGS